MVIVDFHNEAVVDPWLQLVVLLFTYRLRGNDGAWRTTVVPNFHWQTTKIELQLSREDLPSAWTPYVQFRLVRFSHGVYPIRGLAPGTRAP